MDSDFSGPINIGSEWIVTLNGRTEMVMDIAGKKVSIKHIPGPLGFRGRNSNNKLIRERFGWEPSKKLVAGMRLTYRWIASQVRLTGKQNR